MRPVPADRGRGILIVEDEEELRLLMVSALRDHGYGVLAAGGGTEALAMHELLGDRIDLVIADLFLPDMGGQDLVSRLMRCAPELRFMICSGYQSSALAQCDDVAFLPKPFTIEELVRCVDAQLTSGPS